MSKPWKFQQIKPQKARGRLVESIWTDPNWVAEEKYDGDRRIAQFCGKVVRFTGCRESVDGSGFVEKTENVPHLSGKLLKKIHIGSFPDKVRPRMVPLLTTSLDGTVLDGEMVVPLDEIAGDYGGGKSKYVTSIMGSLPEEAIKKQLARGWLRYVVFDCLFYKGKDVRGESLYNRRALVERALKEWDNPFVLKAEQSSVTGGQASSHKEFYEEIVSLGGEGVVLKRLDHTYGDEKLWVKVKKEATADVVIMGFGAAKKESKKKGDTKKTITKFAKLGLIGNIICGQWKSKDRVGRPLDLMEVATVSGIHEGLRADMTTDPDMYIGRVIEIKHNGREPTGRFRHPRFSRFRNDKSPEDCVYDLEET